MTKRAAASMAVVLAAALLASCSGGSSDATEDASPKVVPVKAWLADACATLGEARDIQVAPLLGDGPAPSIETKAQRQAVRVDLAEELTDRERAVDELSAAVAKNGRPDSRGGSLLVQQLQTGLSDLSERYERTSAKVSQVPAGDPDVFEAKMSSAMGELDQGSSGLDEVKRAIFADPAMADLLLETESCQGL